MTYTVDCKGHVSIIRPVKTSKKTTTRKVEISIKKIKKE